MFQRIKFLGRKDKSENSYRLPFMRGPVSAETTATHLLSQWRSLSTVSMFPLRQYKLSHSGLWGTVAGAVCLYMVWYGVTYDVQYGFLWSFNRGPDCDLVGHGH